MRHKRVAVPKTTFMKTIHMNPAKIPQRKVKFTRSLNLANKNLPAILLLESTATTLLAVLPASGMFRKRLCTKRKTRTQKI